MIKICVLLISFMLLTAGIYAQAETGNNIIVRQDPRLDHLVNKQIEINEVSTRDSRRFVPGFRILAVSSNDRNKVIEAKSAIYRKFPELTSYMMYQSPFFRLKVGNFRDRLDAEEYLSGIQELFPGNKAYVVPDRIEVRPEPNQK
jgi:hypothetical protein